MAEGEEDAQLGNRPTRLQVIENKTRKVVVWFPVVLVLGILVYAYYVFVIEYCFLTLLEYEPAQVVKATLYLVFFNILILLFLSNFLITTFRRPGSPLDYHLEVAQLANTCTGFKMVGDRKVFVLPVSCERYCGICDTPKPDRCHHCSECNQCILKMDHHCPWFNNCIGYRNYKFFSLTLLYGMLLCIFVFATLLQELIWELDNHKTSSTSIQFLVIDVIAGVMGLAIIALFVYHLFLVCRNQTTIEYLDRKERKGNVRDSLPINPFDLGVFANLQQVFGNNPLFWLLPTPHDQGSRRGLIFPKGTTQLSV